MTPLTWFSAIAMVSLERRVEFSTLLCLCSFLPLKGVIWYPLRDFIPGSAEALAHLELRGKQVTFVTNNSISSIKEHIEKFEKQGNLKIEEVNN